MTESQPFDKSRFSASVLSASAEDRLLIWLSEQNCNSAHPHYEEIRQALIELHNSKELNFLRHIDSDGLKRVSGHDYWSIQHLFNQIAPELDTDVDQLISAVNRLVGEAGDDMAANQPNAAFRKWLKRRPNETTKLLEKLREGADDQLSILTFVLEAGASHNLEHYHAQAIELLSDARPQARLSALSALTRIEASGIKELHLTGLESLRDFTEKAEAESEMSSAIRALLENYARAADLTEDELTAQITREAAKDSAHVHYQLATVLSQHHAQFSTNIQIAIISVLSNSDPDMKGVIDQIDFAFSQCISSDNRCAIADCVEQLLNHPEHPLDLANLDSFVHQLAQKHPDSLGWLIIHWLRFGSHKARLSLAVLLRRFATDGYEPQLPIEAFDFSDAELVFIARKALGYFLVEAATAASILVAALRATKSKEATQTIADLLFDPLMINFSGQAREIVERRAKKGVKQKFLRSALTAHDNYLKGLRSLAKIPELWPSPSQRQAQSEKQRRQFASSYKEAEASSVFANIFSKQTLLHGAGSVTYLRDFSGTLRRSESLLSSHGTSMEFPRLEILDPIQFQHFVFHLRNETIDQ